MNQADTEGSVLREATHRLSRRIETSDPNLPEPEVLRRELVAVSRMVEEALEGRKDTDPDDSGVEVDSLLRLRFLELLRTEVLTEWPDPTAKDPPLDLLPLMRAFERVRARLDPDAPHLLGAPVLDLWARRLLGEMAHTLGSSLGPMVMLTEVLASGESGEVNELQRSQIRILYRAALTTGSMASDILRLAGPFEEPEEGTSGMFSLGELLDAVEAVLGPLLSERQVESRIGGEDGSGRPRVGRAFALRRSLVSLSIASMGDAPGGAYTLTAHENGESVAFEVARRWASPEAEKPPEPAALFRERAAGRGWQLSRPALAAAVARELIESLGGELRMEGTEAEVRYRFEVPLPRVSDGTVLEGG